jgi:predicted nucleic acid-binding protein
MIVVDANFLVLLLDPGAMPQIDRGRERVAYFISQLTASNEEIMIPASVIAEVVAGRVERTMEIVEELRRHRCFIVQPLDEVIAIETGTVIRAAIDRTPPGERPAGWKVVMKYDAQIAATARVRKARALCTADGGFQVYLEGTEIGILHLEELPLPPASPQTSLPFDAPAVIDAE